MTSNHDPHRMLAGDILPWERQPDETEMAYAAFKAWLDSDKRRVSDHGPTAKDWSARYSWSMRAHEYDLWISRVDLEEQTRYRRKMNERHRQVASVAQSKLVQWLNGLDEKAIARMSVADATRLLDVAVKIERAAVSAVGAEDMPGPYYEPARENKGGLEQRMKDAGLNVPMSEVARLLHEKLGPPAAQVADFRHKPPEPRSEPQAQDPAPIPPLETPPDGETPQEPAWGQASVWGERFDPDAGQHGSPR